jgi:DNA-binding response OmpR family regulator
MDEPTDDGHTNGGDSETQTTVLVVEDDADLAALYAEWLADDYDVRVAHSGKEALSVLADVDVDVALLDRRMGTISGDEVLEEIRKRGYDCRVAMVTAVDPDLDVVDMPFDDYLTKPVKREALHEMVAGLTALVEYSEFQLKLSSKRVRRSVLQGEKRPEELSKSERFQRLEAEIETLEEQLSDIETSYPGYEPLFERIR